MDFSGYFSPVYGTCPLVFVLYNLKSVCDKLLYLVYHRSTTITTNNFLPFSLLTRLAIFLEPRGNLCRKNRHLWGTIRMKPALWDCSLHLIGSHSHFRHCQVRCFLASRKFQIVRYVFILFWNNMNVCILAFLIQRWFRLLDWFWC